MRIPRTNSLPEAQVPGTSESDEDLGGGEPTGPGKTQWYPQGLRH